MTITIIAVSLCAGTLAALLTKFAFPENESTVLKSLSKISMEPGEVLFITIEDECRRETMKNLADYLNSLFPNNKVVVVQGNMKLQIVGPKVVKGDFGKK